MSRKKRPSRCVRFPTSVHDLLRLYFLQRTYLHGRDIVTRTRLADGTVQTAPSKGAMAGEERREFNAQKARGAEHNHSPRTTRTTGSEMASCRQCGGAIAGRRRNGFCSDACRMRSRRTERDGRVRELVADVERAVSALKAELAGPGGADAPPAAGGSE